MFGSCAFDQLDLELSEREVMFEIEWKTLSLG